MNSLQDAIYNWLTIKVVVDKRPDDTAAVETEKMFYDILISEYQLENMEVNKDETMYEVTFTKDGEEKKYRFPRELIEVMLQQIEREPDKYRNFS